MSADQRNEKIKQLRLLTGAPINKIKDALDACKEDVEAAIEHLRRTGVSGAAKKESREVKEGTISLALGDGVVALVEVKVETDFVAKNERFQDFSKKLSAHLLETGLSELDAFTSSLIEGEKSVDEIRKEFIAVMGENTQIGKLLHLKAKSGFRFATYSHMGGKIVSIVEFEGDSSMDTIMRDVAMHIAAEAPGYLSSDQIPAEVVEKERSIVADQIKGKPANIVEKIVDGKIKDFYKQNCLLQQSFIKDPSLSVEEYVRSKTAGKGKIVGFYRVALGA